MKFMSGRATSAHLLHTEQRKKSGELSAASLFRLMPDQHTGALLNTAPALRYGNSQNLSSFFA